MSRVITWESDSASLGPAVVAMGVFDGVHIGHRALISDAVARAREAGVASAVLTFDRDPDQVVTPESTSPQLLPLKEKIERIADLGVDVILVVAFCVRLATTTPDRFLDDILCQAFEPVAVVVGHDFRFGQHASGTVATLRAYGDAQGFLTVDHDLVRVDGQPVTSTRIRALVAAGEVEAAAVLLGRSHCVSGRVVHGRGIGESLLGIPTANISPAAHSALPADGVYAGVARIDGTAYAAGISVGLPPTFPEARDPLEAHLLDFAGDLYATDITIDFCERLREQRHFDSPAELASAIEADLARVRLRIALPTTDEECR
ncbi:MAG: riboflavin biosynthesis protein RibF [Coriobacteriia bacterium]|nr:riboflavin biosynthesis protein RibF [Coriobacteriia bacterium]